MVLTRVGILGGTFDPVHRGHVEIARRAMEEAALERVIFIPAAQPRLKSGEPSATPQQRMEMLRLAVEDAPGFEVSGMELRRSGPTLTVETLWEIREERGPDTELVFILGLDVLGRFDQWVEPGRVVELARLLAVSRPGYAGFDWFSFYARNPYADGRVDCIESTDIDISASELRRRLSNGQAVSGLLPEAVERYIRENGLYGGG
jgi:nicotinate-nucleotide adenylyltransferase